jgi:anti-anti-sigma regulatory factor
MTSIEIAQAVDESASVIHLAGVLRRRELRALADGLDRISPKGDLLLDWSGVSHLDYRGLREFAVRILSLRKKGMNIHSSGIDSYLLALACVSLSMEEVEGFVGASAAAGAGVNLTQVLSAEFSEN